MAKEGETFFFYLPTCLVYLSTRHLPTCLFSSSTRQLVYLSTCQLVNSSTCQLVNIIQYSLNYAKKYIKFCRL